MNYTLVESHRQHFKENYNLGKLALQNGKENRANAYFKAAIEDCQYIIANTDISEEKKRYKQLREKIVALMEGGGTTNEDDTNTDEKIRDTSKSNSESPAIKVVKPKAISLEEALKQLDNMTGLDAVKSQVHAWVDQIRVFKLRKMRGLNIPEMSYHMVFKGNPGTGKTTVARIMAQIYRALGILKSGQFVEADRSALVAGYVGQTALKTQDVINKALGGELFIDEAYMLSHGGSNDFGQEAIDTILKAMEDHRDELVVIVAGYDDLMDKFIESNPGLRSRFKHYINFCDYTGEEMLEIFKGLCSKNQYVLNPESEQRMAEYFDSLYENRNKNFGNGRDVRNLFESVVTNQSQRIARLNNPDNATITEIKAEDLPF